jgi:hypothetical protein
MNTSDCGLLYSFKDTEALVTAMTDIKNPVMKYLSGAKYSGIIKVPRFLADKLNDQFGRTWGLYLETCLPKHSDMKLLLVLL